MTKTVRKLFLLGFIFTTLFCMRAEAEYNYFRSDKEKQKLTKELFIRFLKPHLKGMLAEFFLILKKANPVQQEIITLRNQILEINLAWHNWLILCPKMSEECEAPLLGVYQLLHQLDFMLNDALSNKVKLKGLQAQSDIDATLMLMRDLDKVTLESYALSHQMEELLITINTGYYYNKSHPDLSPILHSMLISSEFIMTSQIESLYRKDIEYLWEVFFKQIERRLIIDNDHTFLLNGLGDLNVAWNGFHMRMAKSSLHIDKEIVNLIELMHNRWNVILRYILE
ncbi:MAG: hypothetical protein A2X86_19525 [Bdellovibrionales bacterium GWA2_49_15]|nr:MAG: hypothetical protein A2X86_19525 [Bdellovibrionales bacterium GWA2_49_15]HAZ14423.1 hypothetical protein [Bdellovibrionales bacterium]